MQKTVKLVRLWQRTLSVKINQMKALFIITLHSKISRTQKVLISDQMKQISKAELTL